MHAVFLRRRFWSVAVVLATLSANAGAASPWEIWTSPYLIARLDPADQVFERSSHCLDGCRYDRGNQGAEGSIANPYPNRWLYANGAEEIVFEDDGPGAITRSWMTTGNGVSSCIDPQTQLHIYIDGAATPTLNIALATFFSGAQSPFTPPLAYANTQSSGGYVNYVPMAYQYGVRIALVNADDAINSCTGSNYRLLWFQFQYHRLPVGSLPVSFDASGDAIGWRSFLATAAGSDPWSGQGVLSSQTFTTAVTAGSSQMIASQNGSGWLRALQLSLPRSAYPHVHLRLAFDGVTAVDMPIADFFAFDGSNGLPANALLMGESNAGNVYSWWPMPFRQQASVELLGDAQLSTSINMAGTLAWDASPVSTDAAYFTTQLHDVCPSAVGQDLSLYSASGAGRLVGISATYHAYGASTREYLEGDERAYRDGSRDPVWYGTGVEDFFNGGFYFDHGAYAHALSGATRVDVDGSGVTSAYRLLLGDYLSYDAGLDLRQEAGPTGQLPICARSVVYAYAKPQALMMPYARLDVGDATSVQLHGYQAPIATTCAVLSAQYADEPPTSRTAQVCSYDTGSSHFAFSSDVGPLRLRRVFDAAQPGQAAEIWVNGSLAGYFSYTPANPLRRWSEQDALLTAASTSSVMQFEIRPRFSAPDGATTFTESAYELWGFHADFIFRDGFDIAP